MCCCFCLIQGPGPNARVVYIDGAFDLFHAGHVEVLNILKLLATIILSLNYNCEKWMKKNVARKKLLCHSQASKVDLYILGVVNY